MQVTFEKLSLDIKKFKNPYGDGGATEKIANKIFSLNLDKILKKTFHDL